MLAFIYRHYVVFIQQEHPLCTKGVRETERDGETETGRDGGETLGSRASTRQEDQWIPPVAHILGKQKDTTCCTAYTLPVIHPSLWLTYSQRIFVLCSNALNLVGSYRKSAWPRVCKWYTRMWKQVGRWETRNIPDKEPEILFVFKPPEIVRKSPARQLFSHLDMEKMRF